MVNAVDIAMYFIKKDADAEIFTSETIKRGKNILAVGNAKINKFLHISQNMWIARTGKLLFPQCLYAFDNGAVVEEVRLNYNILVKNSSQRNIEIPSDVAIFLDKIYIMLRNATIDELIDLSHQDNEWLSKNKYSAKHEQAMDSLSRKDEYKEQYADALVILDRIKI